MLNNYRLIIARSVTFYRFKKDGKRIWSTTGVENVIAAPPFKIYRKGMSETQKQILSEEEID